MRRITPTRPVVALLFAVTVSIGYPAVASAVTITEFSGGISASSTPHGIAAGPDGNVWFTELNGQRIGRITPAGVVTEFSAGITPDSFPTRIVAGLDGNLWFTEQGANRVGRITPSGVVIDSAGVSASPVGIAVGPDGNVWFTEQFADRIGRITSSGTVTEFSAGISANSQPREIVTGPDGNLWFTEFGADRIGRITPSGTVTEFSAGIGADSGLVGIAAGPDGNLWFTEFFGNRIGRITPSGTVTEFSAGIGGNTGPIGIVAGPDGNLWFTENNGGRIGRITPSGAVTEFSAGISPNSGPFGIVTGPDGNVWFTEALFQGNRIGRLVIEPPEAAVGTAQGITLTEATLTGTVDPRGDPTSVFFEYGTAGSTPSRTQTQNAGTAAGDVSAAVTGLQPETTYQYRLVAINAGEQRVLSADTTFTTAAILDRDKDGSNRPDDCNDNDASIHPGAVDLFDNGIDEDCVGGPAANPDRDSDGAIRPADCDDNNPRIKPGARDVPQNGIDEDCSSRDAPYPKLDAYIDAKSAWYSDDHYLVLLGLGVESLAGGEKVTVACRAPRKHRRSCPFPRRVRTAKRGVMKLGSPFRARRLRPGTRLEVTVTRPGAIGRSLTIRVGTRGGKRTRACLMPTTDKRLPRCPA